MTDIPALTSDCRQCAALCCVGLTLEEGDLYGFDKPAGTPCPKLDGHLCSVHSELTDIGNRGCVLFECAGAGQRVTQERFNGESWRDDPTLLRAMVSDFNRLLPLHERMAQLVEAGRRALPFDLERERAALLARHARLWSDSDALRHRFDAFLDALADLDR